MMTEISQYTIRDAVPSDAEEIIRMHAQVWLDTYPNSDADVSWEWVERRVAEWSTPERLHSRRRRIQEARESPDMFYKVALNEDGAIVGMACPIRDKDSQRVGGLYVDKKYHGKGVAQQLMAEIISWADPTKPLELEVASYNKRAKRFYEKYNFKKVPGTETKHADTIPITKMIRKGDKQ